MRLSRESVLVAAFAILDRYGLADLTMRRLAGELGVQPGGLYWHFANKQTLLAAMADRIAAGAVSGAVRPAADDVGTVDTGDGVSDVSVHSGVGEEDWRAELTRISGAFRRALLEHRDGAELVAAGYALHPGSGEPLETMIKIIQRAGLEPSDAQAAAAALIHFVLGHAAEVQAHDQLRRAAALPAEQDRLPDPARDFTVGLEIFLDGLRSRAG